MPNEAIALDSIFHALANPTRREVLGRLGRGPVAMTELSKAFQMALPSFLQHLQVLEKCGLVRSRKTGRVRVYELEPAPMKAAEHWLEAQRTQWETRLDQLDEFLISQKEKQNEN